ncbi:MAG: hypothetical protein ACO3UW_03715 [Candidatus Nanopelagicales bacterium]
MSDTAAARERMYERARKSGFSREEARDRSDRAVAEAARKIDAGQSPPPK